MFSNVFAIDNQMLLPPQKEKKIKSTPGISDSTCFSSFFSLYVEKLQFNFQHLQIESFLKCWTAGQEGRKSRAKRKQPIFPSSDFCLPKNRKLITTVRHWPTNPIDQSKTTQKKNEEKWGGWERREVNQQILLVNISMTFHRYTTHTNG